MKNEKKYKLESNDECPSLQARSKLIYEKLKAHKIYLEVDLEKAEKQEFDTDYIEGAIDATEFAIALFENE
jgi:hypothetical protein